MTAILNFILIKKQKSNYFFRPNHPDDSTAAGRCADRNRSNLSSSRRNAWSPATNSCPANSYDNPRRGKSNPARTNFASHWPRWATAPNCGQSKWTDNSQSSNETDTTAATTPPTIIWRHLVFYIIVSTTFFLLKNYEPSRKNLSRFVACHSVFFFCNSLLLIFRETNCYVNFLCISITHF